MKRKNFFVSLFGMILIFQMITLNVYSSGSYQLKDFLAGNDSPEAIVKNINLFVFDDLDVKNSDVEGRIAVEGDLNISNYSVGSKLEISSKRGDLIVGGSIKAENGQVFAGNTIVGDSAKIEKYNFNNPNGLKDSNNNKCAQPIVVKQNELKDFFNTKKSQLKNLSNDLAEIEGTEKGKIDNGSLTLSGSNNKLNVYNINADNLYNSGKKLEDLSYIKINLPESSVCLINVSGNNSGFGNYHIDLNGIKAEHVLWNFKGVTNAFVKNISIKGSILAPDTKWELRGNGNIDGSFIAGSIDSKNGSLEFHNHTFGGLIPSDLKSCTPTNVIPTLTPTESTSITDSDTKTTNDIKTKTPSPTESKEAKVSEYSSTPTSTVSDSGSMPKTGEKSSIPIYLAGIVITLSGIGFLVFKKLK